MKAETVAPLFSIRSEHYKIWKVIGKELGIDIDTLNSIEEDHATDLFVCLHKMISSVKFTITRGAMTKVLQSETVTSAIAGKIRLLHAKSKRPMHKCSLPISNSIPFWGPSCSVFPSGVSTASGVAILYTRAEKAYQLKWGWGNLCIRKEGDCSCAVGISPLQSKGVWGHAPPKNFEILDTQRMFLKPFDNSFEEYRLRIKS